MIRKLKNTDKNDYFALAEEFYTSPAVLHRIPNSHIGLTFEELMKSDKYTECFVDEQNDEITGYMLISYTFSQEAGGKVVWLEELFVKKEYRGTGIGTAFINFLEKNIHAARYRIEAEINNNSAISLYNRMGFNALNYIQLYKGS
jgi:GNAT superfamily N-acetyltransferase